MFSFSSPGDNGDSLHTCGAADADLCPASHHHVLPGEVPLHSCALLVLILFFFFLCLVGHFEQYKSKSLLNSEAKSDMVALHKKSHTQ